MPKMSKMILNLKKIRKEESLSLEQVKLSCSPLAFRLHNVKSASFQRNVQWLVALVITIKKIIIFFYNFFFLKWYTVNISPYAVQCAPVYFTHTHTHKLNYNREWSLVNFKLVYISQKKNEISFHHMRTATKCYCGGGGGKLHICHKSCSFLPQVRSDLGDSLIRIHNM